MDIKILVTDDDPSARDLVSEFLAGQAGLRVVGHADSGEQALRLTEELRPDVVLMDLDMDGISGVEATRRLHAARPEVRVIAVSIHSGPGFRRAMAEAGAVGFVAKEEIHEELAVAIRGAMEEATPSARDQKP